MDFEISDLRMQPYGRLFGVEIVLVFSMSFSVFHEKIQDQIFHDQS